MATLEFVRLLSGSTNIKQPGNSFGAIILIILTFYVSLFSSLFQSYLSSIKIVTHSSQTIDTLEDLVQSKLEVYGLANYKNMITQREIRDRYHFDSFFGECAKRLERGENVPCVHPQLYLKFFFSERVNSFTFRKV